MTAEPPAAAPRGTLRGLRSAPGRVAAATVLALAGDVAFDPSHRHVPLCPFRALTGWWCPLCGGLRCADALAHGHLGQAVHDNVLLVAALPLLAWAWLDWVARSRAGKPARRLGAAGVALIVAVLVAFTVVRNLPPAGFLRPV